MSARISLTLPCDAQTIGYVRTMTSGALRLLGTSDDVINDACLVVSEACSNAVEHAAGGEAYDVTLDVTPRRLVVVVSDQGPGVPAAAVDADMPPPLALSGRGLPLIRALTDAVAVSVHPGSGTTIQITKTLSDHVGPRPGHGPLEGG